MHTSQALTPLCGAAFLVAAPWACSAEHDDAAPTETRSLSQPLRSWVNGGFEQVLRVNPGETKIRHRCELTVPLSAAKALTFSASTGSATESIGWTGAAAESGKLKVSACAGYPCEVVATWRAGGASGSTMACAVTADDGTSSLIGTSTGNVLAVPSAPTNTIMFNQQAKLGPPATSIAGRCTFRQSATEPTALVTGLSVHQNGVLTLGPLADMAIGDVPYPTKWGPLAFGNVYVGAESVDAGPAATQLKHVTARKEKLVEGDALRCAGEYQSSTGVKVFDVNVSNAPAGDGVSLVTGPTGRTCAASHFGTGDGCHCDCGIIDPDCAVDECDCSIVNRNTGFENAPDDVSPWVLTGNTAQADWADFDIVGGYAATGDDDYGVVLQGGVAGPGTVYQDVVGTAGTTYSLTADLHVEPNFDASTIGLKLEWWDVADQKLGEADTSLVGTVLTGSDATDPGEWQSVSVQGTAPTGTTRVTGMIYFDGATDIGGLQDARVDNVVLLDGPAACSTAGTTQLDVSVFGQRIMNNELYVVSLQEGDTVTLAHTGGAVNFNTNGICAAPNYLVGPNGLNRASYDPSNLCYSEALLCIDPILTAGHAGLYRLDGGVRTFVGSGDSWQAVKPVDLFLGINDCLNSSSPNSGFFDVSVTIE